MSGKRRAAPPKVSIDPILQLDARALERLAGSDRATWQCLIAHASASEACPPDLTRALLTMDDYDGWVRRVFGAYAALHPDDGMGADHEFERWFAAGIARTFPEGDPRVLEIRYRGALIDPAAKAATHTRELVDAIERADVSKDLLGRAYLLLAWQLGEDLDHDAAIAASRSAEDAFATLGDETWRAQAVRMRGAALLRAGRIDEALAVLDTVGDAPSTSFASRALRRYGGVVLGSDGHYRPERELDPVAAVLYRAADIAVWAPARQLEWLRALGTIARATGHRGCAERAAEGRDDDEETDWMLPRQMR